jgi:hypothetical protein
MIGQPLAALGQGLGMGEHLADPLHGATAEQGMPNRQHQGPGDREVRVFPEGVETGGHSSLDRVLNRHDRRITATVGHGLDDGTDAQLGHQLSRASLLQLSQLPGRLLAIGTGRAEEGNAHRLHKPRKGTQAGR